MREIEKLDAGQEYYFLDPEVVERKAKSATVSEEFNAISSSDPAAQEKKAKEILGSHGKRVSMQAPIHFDNGKNIHVGEDFLSNYNLTILDIAPVNIGHNVMIGPNVDIYTVNHPTTAIGRREYLAQATPVNIGNDVWIGGRVVILPGVTIGNNVVIAAGAVVTHDIPDNSIAAGVPTKVIKHLVE